MSSAVVVCIVVIVQSSVSADAVLLCVCQDKNRRLYAAMVHYMDEKLGLFVDALQKKNMWENTLMVSTALAL